MSDFRDPVHQNEDGKWYFWDECWAFEEGSYDTEKQAREYLDKYYSLFLMKGEQNGKTQNK